MTPAYDRSALRLTAVETRPQKQTWARLLTGIPQHQPTFVRYEDALVNQMAVSTAFHMQDRRGATLATYEADGLPLGYEIVDHHFKLREAPK